MRQIALTVPTEASARVAEAAGQAGASIFAEINAHRGDDPCRLFILEVPNARVEDLFGALENIEPVRASFLPAGILSLRSPSSEPETAMLDIQPRSPLEIFLGALQSIGSWSGFLGYSAVAGVIVWVGLFTQSVFLLVAAMLIAPFAGPAMTAALATARGDAKLLGRSLLRYVAALATTITIAFVLSVVFDQHIATELMVTTSQRSTVSLLLPLAAGVAGALNLAQSERSSLVSGAATGMLIAAALAPPAGLVGMGLAIGQTDIVNSSLWALAIQIVGINLAGFLVFRIYGMKSKGARYPRGKTIVSMVSVIVSLGGLAGLIALQFSHAPEYQQSSIAQRISASVKQQVEARSDIALVSVDAQFSRQRSQGENPVWVDTRIQGSLSNAESDALSGALANRIEHEFGIDALVNVTAIP